jgi:diguanylate cyclase (GGDEF)-like protein
MRKYLGLEVLANWVSMLRADVDGAIWLCDHDQEAIFYEKCAHDLARVVPAPGIAMQVLEFIRQRGIKGVVASLNGSQEPTGADVFRPGLGDVGALLLFGRSSRRTIEDIVGIPWLKTCEKLVGPLINRAVHIANVFGVIRRQLTNPNDPNFSANSLQKKVVNWEDFSIDADTLSSILEDSDRGRLSLAELAALTTLHQDFQAALRGCDGFEAIDLIAAATKRLKPRGLSPVRSVDTVDLTGMLRVAYDLEDLERDVMFWKMRNWQRTEGYSLLRDWRSLDPLKVLWDQRYWENDLSSILNCCALGEPFVAFKMDLDNFSQVNTNLGHAGGDEAIRIYGNIVRDVLGTVAEVYRRGGDEVVAFAPGLGAETAQKLANTVRLRLEEAFRAWASQKQLPNYPTASIGVVITTQIRSPEEVIAMLDDVQLRAKKNGKNQVVCAHHGFPSESTSQSLETP